MPEQEKSHVIFHAGLNKCGSSFLQELFKHNFSLHSASSVFYPQPHKSSGNAAAFSSAIRELDYEAALASLHKLLKQGKSKETVILSTEFMYHQFVKPEQRNMIFSCLSESGIEDFTFVFVFRNVFEHAVSAYCHRCGIHAMPPFESWIVDTPQTSPNFRSGITCYEFWSELRLLLVAVNDERFNIRFFPYSKKMTSEWSHFLGVELLPPPRQTVNATVTPSEAEILRRLRDRNGFSMEVLRQKFKAFSRSEKGDDALQTRYYHTLINREIERHVGMIRQAEAAFGFEISKPPLALEADASPSISYNERQLDAIVEHMDTRPKVKVKDRVRQMVPEPLRPLARSVKRIFQQSA